MDYKDRCRTCLGRTKEMHNINSRINIAGTAICLSDVLKNFYEYVVSPDEEGYPSNICINCVHHLTLTHSFKILIEASAQTLIDSICKVEYIEDESYGSEIDSDYKPVKKNQTHCQKQLPRNYSRPINSTKHFRKTKQIIRIKKSLGPECLLFCVECKARFYTQGALSEHCRNSHTVKSLTGRDCQYCNEKFEDFKELVIHRKLHLKPHLCLTCWAGFYDEDDFKCHVCKPNQGRDTSLSDKARRQCDQCGKSYPPGYIKVHMMTHGNDLRYSCKYCPKKFKVANGLNSHVLWNHKRTRDHKCEVCNATFISASARSTHVRKNHLKEKKYGCESCAKRFFSKSELQRHMLTHTGVKNFHCHVCDKSYQTRYGLNVHLKSQHAHASSVHIF